MLAINLPVIESLISKILDLIPIGETMLISAVSPALTFLPLTQILHSDRNYPMRQPALSNLHLCYFKL